MAVFSTFNPSAMGAELIEGTFVQREPLAERLVDVFEESARRESKHNVLLVGPRGIGKSHLVSLVYHRLKAKEGLSDKLRIAYLREDEWGINSFVDLLMRTLQAAFDEADLELPEGIGELSELSRTEAADHVWRVLRDMLGKRTLLLIIENLDAVFEKIGDAGQKQWRALMQTCPQWAVLATTPALFSGISRQVSPFYGFFEVIHLQPLSTDDAVELLQRLARWNKDEETAAFLETAVGRARVRAVQHIAGGNHRVFVLFYDFLSQGGFRHFVTPLLKTIDALTPYYQSQMARLSPQQQKIVNFLCEHRKPATVTAIAKTCLTTHQTAASQLRQLLTCRYVRVDRIGRESFYELTEPLLRICVEAKTHRERPLDLLVDFIRYWFSREELERKLSGVGDSSVEKPYFLAALKEYDEQDAHVHLNPAIASLCAALRMENDPPELLQTKALELAKLSEIAEDWTHYIRAMVSLGKVGEAIPKLEEMFERQPDNVEVLRSLAGAHARVGSTSRAKALLDRAIILRPNYGLLFLDKGDLLLREDRNEEALEAYEKASALFNSPMQPVVALDKARAFVKLEQFKAAREVLSPVLSKGDRFRGIFFHYGTALANEKNYKEALKYFDKAARAFQNDWYAWGNKGIVLCKLERYGEALEALDRSLAANPVPKPFLYHRCEALLETRQYSTAVETIPREYLSHGIFHQLLKIGNSRPKQGELQQALLKLKNADDSKAWGKAFLGALTEFASFAKSFRSREEFEQLRIWNSTLQELFTAQKSFSILLKLFDVLTRVKLFDDRKALLELPREQRLLLIGEESEEESLGHNEGTA